MNRTTTIASFMMLCFLTWGAGSIAETQDSLAVLFNENSLGAWNRAAPAEVYDKDNVFELINGEAELYFPYGFKRVVAAEYAQAADAETTVSVEVYELASLLDAFGVYSNYRDEESKTADVGAEAVAGSTQVMFYQDVFFVKARTHKTDRQDQLLEFAREFSKVLPQRFEAPPEPGVLDVKGVVPASCQYIAQSVLGYDFFKKGMVADAFLEDDPAEDAKPLRVFVMREESEKQAELVLQKYIHYLSESTAERDWTGGGKVLKAIDPLHKGVLIKQTGPFVIGVAKLPPDVNGLPLIYRLGTKLSAWK